MKREFEGRSEAARVARFGIVDEDAVGIADDAVGVEEEAMRDDAAVRVAANPAEGGIIGPKIGRSAFRLVAAMRAVRIDEGLKSLGVDDQFLREEGVDCGGEEREERKQDPHGTRLSKQ